MLIWMDLLPVNPYFYLIFNELLDYGQHCFWRVYPIPHSHFFTADCFQGIPSLILSHFVVHLSHSWMSSKLKLTMIMMQSAVPAIYPSSVDCMKGLLHILSVEVRCDIIDCARIKSLYPNFTDQVHSVSWPDDKQSGTKLELNEHSPNQEIVVLGHH